MEKIQIRDGKISDPECRNTGTNTCNIRNPMLLHISTVPVHYGENIRDVTERNGVPCDLQIDVM
jgi:hypothetical protein